MPNKNGSEISAPRPAITSGGATRPAIFVTMMLSAMKNGAIIAAAMPLSIFKNCGSRRVQKQTPIVDQA